MLRLVNINFFGFKRLFQAARCCIFTQVDGRVVLWHVQLLTLDLL